MNNRPLNSYEIRTITEVLLQAVDRANKYYASPEWKAARAAQEEAAKLEREAAKVRDEKARAIRREVAAPRRRNMWG